MNLFKTFEDLESVNDKQADIQAVRRVLDEDEAVEEETAHRVVFFNSARLI